ncbi:unnamed protein product [Phytophthora lilii]|uniref:Unnamed protein product n=1 Tax=Phytophthora lilii TaxID=2077276 RepID=A0A9W6U7X3_9STRA|nr:unnamed protein product [Phytophthora lilii]
MLAVAQASSYKLKVQFKTTTIFWRNSAVRRINNAMDWDALYASLVHDDDTDGVPVEVCRASLDDWDEYAASEYQELKTHSLERYDGKIGIVECLSPLHQTAGGCVTDLMNDAMGQFRRRIEGHGAAYVSNPPAAVAQYGRVEPDCSYGPPSRWCSFTCGAAMV